jgi:hypothetical protein
MTYVVNTGSVKVSSQKDEENGEQYLHVGDEVPDGLFTDEEVAGLVNDGVLVDADAYKEATPPEVYNQAPGTPSNLEQIEGTQLQMNPPKEGEAPPAPEVVNPADVAPVEGANDPDGGDRSGAEAFEAKNDDAEERSADDGSES